MTSCMGVDRFDLFILGPAVVIVSCSDLTLFLFSILITSLSVHQLLKAYALVLIF